MINVYRLGYISLLLIPLVQNNLRYSFETNSFLASIIIGSLPSFLASLSLSSIGLMISNEFLIKYRYNKFIVILISIAILTIYELSQINTRSLFFDYYDLIFTLIGGLITCVIVNNISIKKKAINDSSQSHANVNNKYI